MKQSIDIDTLFRLYYKPLCLYAARFIGDDQEIEDIVQGSFISLWDYCQTNPTPDSPKSYLYRMVHNRCIDATRHDAKKDVRLDERLHDAPDHELVDRSLIHARLWGAIDSLPHKQKEVLLMSKRDGLTAADIAEKMKISKNTVHNHLTKAMDTLRKKIKKTSPFQ